MAVRERVTAARRIQLARRASGQTSARCNAALTPRDLAVVASLDGDGEKLVSGAIERLGLSARGFTKVLRVARTIADLEASGRVRAQHVAEAIQARLIDRELLT